MQERRDRRIRPSENRDDRSRTEEADGRDERLAQMAEEEREEVEMRGYDHSYSEQGLRRKYEEILKEAKKKMEGLGKENIVIDSSKYSEIDFRQEISNLIGHPHKYIPPKKPPEPEKSAPNPEPTDEVKKLREQTKDLRRWLKKKGRKQ